MGQRVDDEDAQARRVAAAVARRVGAADLVERTARYAVDERLSGSPAEAETAARLAADLRALGLKVDERRVRALTSRPGRAFVRLGGTIYPGVAAAFSAPAGERRAPALVARPGSEAQWRGRVVVLAGPPSAERTALAQAAGAAALVHLVAGAQPRRFSVSPVWGSPTPWTVGNLPDLPVVILAGSVAETFAAYAAGADGDGAGPSGPTVAVTAGVDTRWRDVAVVTADLVPAHDADGDAFVLVGGHLDAWHAGARDNAAGLATLVELARALVDERRRLARGLRIAAWSGHEDGRYAGSQAYADLAWEDLEAHCALYLDVDAPGSPAADPARIPSMAEAAFLTRAAVADVAGVAYAGVRPARAGDQSFWGIGVVSGLCGFGETAGEGGDGAAADDARHGPEDRVEALDADRLARDAAIAAHSAAHALVRRLEPVDLAAGARALTRAVTAWRTRAQGRVDLAAATARAEALVAACERLGAAQAPTRAPRRLAFNRAVRAATRPLVRLGYTASSRFDHDPALPLLPLPTLTAIEAVVEAPAGSAAADLASVAARRAVTATAVTLREARERVESALALAALGGG